MRKATNASPKAQASPNPESSGSGAGTSRTSNDERRKRSRHNARMQPLYDRLNEASANDTTLQNDTSTLDRPVVMRAPFQMNPSDKLIEPSHSNNQFQYDPYDMNASPDARFQKSSLRQEASHQPIKHQLNECAEEMTFNSHESAAGMRNLRNASPADMIMTPSGPMTYTTASGNKKMVRTRILNNGQSTSLPPKLVQRPMKAKNCDLNAVSSLVSQAIGSSALPSPRPSEIKLRNMKVAMKKSGVFNRFEVPKQPKQPRHLAALETGMNAAYKYSKRHGAFNPGNFSTASGRANPHKVSIAAFLAEPILRGQRNRHNARTLATVDSSELNRTLAALHTPMRGSTNHSLVLNKPSPQPSNGMSSKSRDIFVDS